MSPLRDAVTRYLFQIENGTQQNSAASISLCLHVALQPYPQHQVSPTRKLLLLLVCQSAKAGGDCQDRDQGDLGDVGEVAKDLGGASLAITPFLARYFEKRNAALLDASMGLAEYSYIYALAYHDHLLSSQTGHEIFSDGGVISPQASIQLRECLIR